MAWQNVPSVALTSEQKDNARNELNTAKRISSIVSAVIQNTDNSIAALEPEIDEKIRQAKLSLGTRYVADDTDGRKALTELTVGDTCFTKDDGDGKWAIYEVTSTEDGDSGDKVEWTKIMDQDMVLDVNLEDALNEIKGNVANNAKNIAGLSTNLGELQTQVNTIATNYDPTVARNLGSDVDWGL